MAGLSALAVAAVAPLVAIHVDGPPPGHTGGFGEPTCAECHFAPPADSVATPRLLGLPDTFRPGGTYRIRVRFARSGLDRAGFQLAARFADGERAGRQAGRLEPVNRRVAVVDSAGIAYAGHTRVGSEPTGSNVSAWTLEWTAPCTVGEVLFHVAVNAADGDDSPLGDAIFTLVGRSVPRNRP